MLKIGDTVNFHSIIGGPVTSQGHEITHLLPMPNNFGCDVAWITHHSGCVAVAALSNEAHPMGIPAKPPTKSQQRYQQYIDSEYPDSFADFIGVETECRYVSDGYQFINRRRRIEGPCCKLKKDAKAGYKELLKARRA